jgi:two-component system response regulator HydG
VPLEVPPLRSRAEDVPLLFVHFLDLFCRRNQRPRLSVDRGVMERLVAYRWPGNVRELRNVAERLAVFGTDPITEEQLPSTLLAGGATSQLGVTAAVSKIVPLRDFRAQCERDYIESALRRTNWNFHEGGGAVEDSADLSAPESGVAGDSEGVSFGRAAFDQVFGR